MSNSIKAPAVDSLWVHYKHGHHYQVLSVGRMESTGEWLVGYHRYEPTPDGKFESEEVFFRTLRSWYGLVDTIPRFTIAPRQINMRLPEECERQIEPYGDETRFRKTTPA